ncbi:MAG: SpoIIE family protein phosphatase, partial [Bacteroidetes bacterium]|nr:SpoIIE family protein phosphatase [Bacteroidota bacterium]
CTGHGVPGALMSIIGTNLLDDIVLDKLVYNPSDILERMHRRLIRAMNTNDGGVTQDDGMDISVCCIDNQNRTIEIAAANQFLYIIQNGDIRTVRGNIFSLGEKLREERMPVFHTNSIELLPETMIYMFSDGFQDQFGGKDNRKFMASRFKSLLYENHHLPVGEQYELLDRTFNDWKGSNKQIDDVLVVGIRI